MSTPQDEMRAKFEAWAKCGGYSTLFVDGGVCGNSGGPVYSDSRTHAAWWSYQAATAAQAEALAAVTRERDALRSEVELLKDTLVSSNEINNPLSALSIHFLVAAGFVTQDKADEAFKLASDIFGRELRKERAARATLTPTAPGAQEQA